MIAERRGVEAHQIVMSTSMPCFTLKKKKRFTKGEGGGRLKDPPCNALASSHNSHYTCLMLMPVYLTDPVVTKIYFSNLFINSADSSCEFTDNE